MKDYYVYVYLDQTKKGAWFFNEIKFNYRPFYIGKGRGKRDKNHLLPNSLKAINYKNSIIKSILNKTGETPIHYRIYENLTNSEAIQLEIELIKHFGRKDNGTGFLANGTDGGDGANNFSMETLKKVGNPQKKVYQYSLNGELIKEWECISKIDIIKSTSNISTAIKRNGTVGGYIWSYELKDNVQPKIKYQMPNKYVNIKQIDKLTGEVIKIFESALEIEKELNLVNGSRNLIYKCLKGDVKTAFGYKWEC